MKRDLDLLRTILLKIEESDKSISVSEMSPDVDNAKLISFHVKLLLDANYIEATRYSTLGAKYQDFLIHRLTNDGCDYLDAVRNDTIWEQSKKKIVSVGGSATLEVTKAVAVTVAKTILGI